MATKSRRETSRPRQLPREGWAEDAKRIGAEPLTDEERDWMAFGNDDDDGLV